MITTNSLRGRVALMVGHCAGMVDLVALPVWVGTLISGPRGVSTRDVIEAGSVGKALDAVRRSGDPERKKVHRNFATWLVAFGASLVLYYFALWGAIG